MGGVNQFTQDFYKLNPQNVKTYPNGTIVETLDDGTLINYRAISSDGRATLEIQSIKTVKIRYDP